MKIYLSLILLCFQFLNCSICLSGSFVDAVSLIKEYQQLNKIKNCSSDSSFYNIVVRQIDHDTIICIEGGNIEHYAYIGPILPPPPIPFGANEEVFGSDSICLSETKELEYFGTKYYGKNVISIFYEKKFSHTWIVHLFEGLKVENKKLYIMNFCPNTSVSFDYLTSIFKLSCEELIFP